MYDFKYAEEYRGRLKTKLTAIDNVEGRLQYLEKELFYVNMVDHWDNYDQTMYRVLCDEIAAIAPAKN